MSEAVSDTRVPRLALGCRIRALSPNEATLLVPEGALQLKGAAAEIVMLIDGQHSMDAIIVLLQERHHTTDALQISIEAKQFIEKLHLRSVLLWS